MSSAEFRPVAHDKTAQLTSNAPGLLKRHSGVCMRTLSDINVVQATHSGYRADIDGLRAVAVLAVIAYHLNPKRLTGGFVGVDVFFVISGYLITSILLSELQRDKFSYLQFYVRRIRRLFPALLVVMGTVLVAGWCLLLPNELAQLGKHVVAGMLFVSNLVLWSEAGYFDVASAHKPLLHLWSLGVEEQFYIVSPIVLAGSWRLGWCRIRWLIAGLLCSLAICWVLSVGDASAAFYMPFARFWQPMVGVLLALFVFRNKVIFGGSALLRHGSSAAGAALIAGSVVLLDSQSACPWMRAALPTVGAALLIASGPQAVVNRYILSRKPFVLVGLISYPLYLWHWPQCACRWRADLL
jgi:peptidoglycan/LPS O-acetylase OafA/YrhL